MPYKQERNNPIIDMAIFLAIVSILAIILALVTSCHTEKKTAIAETAVIKQNLEQHSQLNSTAQDSIFSKYKISLDSFDVWLTPIIARSDSSASAMPTSGSAKGATAYAVHLKAAHATIDKAGIAVSNSATATTTETKLNSNIKSNFKDNSKANTTVIAKPPNLWIISLIAAAVIVIAIILVKKKIIRL